MMIEYTVTIIGLGGIGSPTAHLAARGGCSRLILYDDDVVETHNIANQSYAPQHIGMPKVIATAQQIAPLVGWHRARETHMVIETHQERVGAETALRGAVVVAVDSIEARREIFTACIYNPAIPLYIEAGAAENRGAVRVLVPHDKDHVAAYGLLLSSYSAEGGPQPCVTWFMGFQFASVIMRALSRLQEKKPPTTLVETQIFYADWPVIETEPIMVV